MAVFPKHKLNYLDFFLTLENNYIWNKYYQYTYFNQKKKFKNIY